MKLTGSVYLVRRHWAIIMRVAVRLLGYAFDELIDLLTDIVAAIQGSGDGDDRAVGLLSDVFEGNTHRLVISRSGGSNSRFEVAPP